MHAFEYPGLDPRFNQAFNTTLSNHTTIVIKKLLHIYKGLEDKNLTQLVDVGGGLGVTLNLITSRYQHIKGINFDLPHVVNHAPSYPGRTLIYLIQCEILVFASSEAVCSIYKMEVKYYFFCRCGTRWRRHVC